MTVLDSESESEKPIIIEILKKYSGEKDSKGENVWIGEAFYLLDTYYFELINEDLLLVNIVLNFRNTEKPWKDTIQISSLEDDGYRITIKVKNTCIECNQEIIITKQEEVEP